jgi:hypothetical protein
MRATGVPAIPTHVRETLTQFDPEVSDQAGSSRGQVDLASERKRNFAQTRSEKRRGSARHSSFNIILEPCDSLSRGQGSCQYAIMHPRTQTKATGQF